MYICVVVYTCLIYVIPTIHVVESDMKGAGEPITASWCCLQSLGAIGDMGDMGAPGVSGVQEPPEPLEPPEPIRLAPGPSKCSVDTLIGSRELCNWGAVSQAPMALWAL
jgi:hypothetical protein